MLNDLRATVEKAIDASIRFHLPGDPDSYHRWDAELEGVEGLLLSAEPFPDRLELLASVRAMRIDMAYDIEDFDSVLLRTSQFLQEVPASHPSFFLTVLLRLRTLHRIGTHDEEVRTCLDVAGRPEIQGSEYVYLLEHLGQSHPGNIPENSGLVEKMNQAIGVLSAQGYRLPENLHGENLEQVAIKVAGELRRANRARGEAMLAGDI